MPVTELKSIEAIEKAKQGEGLIVIDFFATWCGPGKRLSPILLKLSAEHKKATFYKVNLDDGEAICAKYKINSMPTVLLIKKGKTLKKIVGFDEGEIVSGLL